MWNLDQMQRPDVRSWYDKISGQERDSRPTAQGGAPDRNWFLGTVEDAGLPKNLSDHGLHKGACRRLAEAGCSTHEIMPISGRRRLPEGELHTRAANRERLAQTTMGPSF